MRTVIIELSPISKLLSIVRRKRIIRTLKLCIKYRLMQLSRHLLKIFFSSNLKKMNSRVAMRKKKKGPSKAMYMTDSYPASKNLDLTSPVSVISSSKALVSLKSKRVFSRDSALIKSSEHNLRIMIMTISALKGCSSLKNTVMTIICRVLTKGQKNCNRLAVNMPTTAFAPKNDFKMFSACSESEIVVSSIKLD